MNEVKRCVECNHCFISLDPKLVLVGVTTEAQPVHNCMRDPEQGMLGCLSERSGPSLVTSRKYCDKAGVFWIPKKS